MNAAQVHLALNHFPIAAAFLGLLFLTWGIFRASPSAKMGGLVLLISMGLWVLPVFLSGEGSEEIVAHKPGVTESLIREHEEAANLAFYASLTTAAIGLAAFVLLRRGNKFANSAIYVTFILSLATGILFAMAAHRGGSIRHDEIRSSSHPPDEYPRESVDDDD